MEDLKKWLKKEIKYYNTDSLDYKLLNQVLNKIDELEENNKISDKEIKYIVVGCIFVIMTIILGIVIGTTILGKI